MKEETKAGELTNSQRLAIVLVVAVLLIAVFGALLRISIHDGRVWQSMPARLACEQPDESVGLYIIRVYQSKPGVEQRILFTDPRATPLIAQKMKDLMKLGHISQTVIPDKEGHQALLVTVSPFQDAER